MMKRTRVTALLALLLIGLASRAAAHPTGHESRTVAECEKLPGTATAGERGQCLRCVSRPRPHHFHPDMVKGDRCHPNDGRPQ
jgi:hypothetical protein